MAEGGPVDLSSVSAPMFHRTRRVALPTAALALESLPNTLSPALNPNCSKTGPLTIANGLMQLVVA